MIFLKSTYQYDKIKIVKEKRDFMAKRGNILKKITSWKMILFIQCIASVLFLGIIYRLGILPIRYFFIVIAIAALLWLLSFSLMKPANVQCQ